MTKTTQKCNWYQAFFRLLMVVTVIKLEFGAFSGRVDPKFAISCPIVACQLTVARKAFSLRSHDDLGADNSHKT